MTFPDGNKREGVFDNNVYKGPNTAAGGKRLRASQESLPSSRGINRKIIRSQPPKTVQKSSSSHTLVQKARLIEQKNQKLMSPDTRKTPSVVPQTSAGPSVASEYRVFSNEVLLSPKPT